MTTQLGATTPPITGQHTGQHTGQDGTRTGVRPEAAPSGAAPSGTAQSGAAPSGTAPSDADRALKAKHRAIWASGNYAAVAQEVIPSLGPRLVEAARVAPGQRVLDVAAGAGNAAIPAALAGATVVASDLTPELFDAGRLDALKAEVEISWDEADAEALPYADAAFDTVLSCVGVMFAPHHERSAAELLRSAGPVGRSRCSAGRRPASSASCSPRSSRSPRRPRPARSRRRCGGTRRTSGRC